MGNRTTGRFPIFCAQKILHNKYMGKTHAFVQNLPLPFL